VTQFASCPLLSFMMITVYHCIACESFVDEGIFILLHLDTIIGSCMFLNIFCHLSYTDLCP